MIDYDSCWQTSFLDGDPNELIGKDNKRPFVATSSTRGEKDAPITGNTVLGVLCRLIGDQRKLYQARQSDNFYFADIEKKIDWQLLNNHSVSELMYLTNKSDHRCGQGAWLGVLPDNNPWFFSETSPLLWGILYLERSELLDFILVDESFNPEKSDVIDCRPSGLLARLDLIADTKSEEGKPWRNAEKLKDERKRLKEELENIENRKEVYLNKSEAKPPKSEKQKLSYKKKLTDFEKKIETLIGSLEKIGTDEEIQDIDCKLNKIAKKLKHAYPDCDFWNEGQLFPQRLYASALYEQAARLIREGVSLPFVLEQKGKKKGDISIKGFSKNSKAHRGFSGARDWLNPMSGGRKKAVGTPCVIQKQSGVLEINIDVNMKRAVDIKEKIDYAGVSSFYLGKKGLAYVSHIDVR